MQAAYGNTEVSGDIPADRRLIQTVTSEEAWKGTVALGLTRADVPAASEKEAEKAVLGGCVQMSGIRKDGSYYGKASGSVIKMTATDIWIAASAHQTDLSDSGKYAFVFFSPEASAFTGNSYKKPYTGTLAGKNRTYDFAVFRVKTAGLDYSLLTSLKAEKLLPETRDGSGEKFFMFHTSAAVKNGEYLVRADGTAPAVEKTVKFSAKNPAYGYFQNAPVYAEGCLYLTQGAVRGDSGAGIFTEDGYLAALMSNIQGAYKNGSLQITDNAVPASVIRKCFREITGEDAD